MFFLSLMIIGRTPSLLKFTAQTAVETPNAYAMPELPPPYTPTPLVAGAASVAAAAASNANVPPSYAESNTPPSSAPQ